MICDKLSAGIVYNGKNWTPNTQIDYYNRERQKTLINTHIDDFMRDVFTQVSKKGIDKVLTKKNIKEIYEKYCIRMEMFDENKI